MIGKEYVKELVDRLIEGTDLFVVDIHVSQLNDIKILIDSKEGVTIGKCTELSRAVENSLDREKEDFQLEVSSPGLSEPLKVLPQYEKNIGRDVEVVTVEGEKHEGRLVELTDDGFIIEEKIRVKGEKKRPVIKSVRNEFGFGRVRSVKVMVSFK